MEKKLTDKQIRVYRLRSGDFEGLSVVEAAAKMGITRQAVTLLLKRAEESCPELFPILTKQEADAKALLAAGWTNVDIANRLQVSLSRVSQIIGSIGEKEHTTCHRPVKILSYQPHLDSQIRRKF